MGKQKSLRPIIKLYYKEGKNPNKKYPIYLRVTWDRFPIDRATGFSCKPSEWDKEANNGIGGLNRRYDGNKGDINQLQNLVRSRQLEIDTFCEQIKPRRILKPQIEDVLDKKPITRNDKGKDFCDYVMQCLESRYQANKIGKSKLDNGRSYVKLFKEFLKSNGLATHGKDSIYIGDVTVELLEKHIKWRKEIKGNSDDTVNHALTPLLQAIQRATEEGLIKHEINARVQQMRIKVQPSLNETEEEQNADKYLTLEQIEQLRQYHSACAEARRKEYIEIWLFCFHACGMRLVDAMTLQWKHINFEAKTLKKIQVKTMKRTTIPLSDAAIKILRHWQKKNGDKKFVFGLVSEDFNVDDKEQVYLRRNTVDKSINQSLKVVGEQLGFSNLTMHMARHSFAVFAINKLKSMTVVSRMLGHASTEVTEKVYAFLMNDTLADEMKLIDVDFTPKWA